MSKEFRKGLADFGLTYEEVCNWKYCGGNTGRHKNYFKVACPNDDIPESESRCVCGHYIKENCYITDPMGDNLLIIGNTCIKRFIPKCVRTCEICGNTHKNRKVNKCNDCR